MDQAFFNRSDQFIAVANDLASKASPEESGDAMLYATARFMAFLIVRETAGGQGDRQQLVASMLESFSRAIWHHLAQMALPETEPPPQQAPAGAPHKANPDDPDESRLAKAYSRIGRAFEFLDVVLAAYLRGQGEQEAADTVTIPALAEHGGHKEYLASVYRLWEAGLLAEPIAAYVLHQICTMHLLKSSATGYVKDPSLDKETKETMTRLYADYGLHHFATMVRKDPVRHGNVCNEGMAMLLGDAAIQMNVAFSNLRKREHGR